MKNMMQFKITLNYSKPKIWRRIQVPSTYTFWDLHCAIQDAMGWTNSHLHAFYVTNDKGRKPLTIIQILSAIQDPKNDDDKNLLEWMELEDGEVYDATHFSPEEVAFADPKPMLKEYLEFTE